MKAFTDISQSKKLAEFLPLESADFMWEYEPDKETYWDKPTVIPIDSYIFINDIPCWSLVALLSVLPFHLITNNQRYAFNMYKGLDKDGETYMFRYNVFNTDVCLYSTDYYNNPIDACVEMIIKLHELNLL